LEPQQLAQLWLDQLEDEFAQATVIGTAAIALKLIGKAATQQEAHDLAESYWNARNRQRLSG
jgi:anthranilate phosphoribosyltransferase